MSEDLRLSPLHRLLPAVRGLALLVVVVAVTQHVAAALGEAPSGAGSWLWALVHIAAALVSAPLGARVLSLAYPVRGLEAAATDNPAAAVQASAHHLGAAAIAASAWGGVDASSLGVSAAFWALGLLATAAIAAGHRLLTRYADHEEIVAGNIATAMVSAGLHLGIAIVAARAIYGEFAGWQASLTGFALALASLVILWPMRQVVFARLILRMSPRELDRLLAADRDMGLAASEGLFYVVLALGIATWV